jgi:hypothetical protein
MKTIYEYTEVDRLLNPHSYMYTPYLGNDFLQAYADNRAKSIKRFVAVKNKCNFEVLDEYLCDLAILFTSNTELKASNYKYELIKSISSFDRMTEIPTAKLLESLINEQASRGTGADLKSWLDFLVQRFEVTKKLYESYHSKKLRSGKGDNKIIRLYWLLSLLLTLVYFETKNIKYLSTLLKVNDLLCSLSNSNLSRIPVRGIEFVLSYEVRYIEILTKKKEQDTFVFE